MNKKYWDRVAPTFEEEIFDTLKNDRNKTILTLIDQFSSRNSIASDFGCGIGRYLPLLSTRFKVVNAIDLSSNCLKIAQAACSSFDNIAYIKADLAKPEIKVKKADFGISINMVIMPSLLRRMNALRNIFRHLTKNGHLLLVVPSLESALYANFRSDEWNRNSNSRRHGVSSMSLKGKDSVSVSRGLLNWAGNPTKHYLREELILVLQETGFQISSIGKVEYSWEVEFAKPPAAMKAPYPWDWLAICRKR